MGFLFVSLVSESPAERLFREYSAAVLSCDCIRLVIGGRYLTSALPKYISSKIYSQSPSNGKSTFFY
jgi:hypothetical protein